MYAYLVLLASVLPAQSGPRLSDAEFFAALPLQRPELAAVRAAVDKRDWPTAQREFGRYFRANAAGRWYIDPPRPAAAAKKKATKEADELLAHHWRWNGKDFELGPSIDWSSSQMNSGESATNEWNASLNRHFHFRPLYEAFLATGDERYAAEVVNQMLDWIERCPVLEGKSGNSPYHYAWETLNTAVRAADTWPNAIYHLWHSKSLSDERLCLVLRSLVEHARHLERWPTKSGNWRTAESLGMLVVGTVLAEHREADTWRAGGIQRLVGQLQTDVYPDGLQIELALGYNNWVLTEFASVLELAKRNGRNGELPTDYLAQLERMYNYLAYAAMPNGLTPGLHDSGNANPAKLLRAGMEYFPKRTDWLWVATRGSEGATPKTTSTAFPYAGHYVMRSGWAGDDRWLLFDAGPYGSGHQHEDKLHLMAYAYGRQLLLDAGVYMYDRSRWRRYVLSTRGHNTIRVDGEDQNRRRVRDSWVLPIPFRPLDNRWTSTPDFDLAVGRYDDGYGPQGAVRVRHTRAVLFVKPDYWVVVDMLDPADKAEHHYESLFHLGADAASVVAGSHVLTSNAREANMAIWPAPSGELRVVKGIEEEPVQGWARDPKWKPVPTAVLSWKASGRNERATVLYPVAPGKALPVSSVALERSQGGMDLSIGFSDGRRDRLRLIPRYDNSSPDLALEAEVGQGSTARRFRGPAQ